MPHDHSAHSAHTIVPGFGADRAAHYDTQAAVSLAGVQAMYELGVSALASQLDGQEAASLLFVGLGTGAELVPYNQFDVPGWRFTGVDPSDAMLAVARHGIDYGRARLWGSISFMVVATGGGLAIAGQSERVLWLIVAAVALTAAAALLLPDIRTARHRDRTGALRTLLADRRFVAFLATAGCLQCSHAMIYGFGTLHWQGAGLSPGFVGILWAESVVADGGAAACAGLAGLGLLGFAFRRGRGA